MSPILMTNLNGRWEKSRKALNWADIPICSKKTKESRIINSSTEINSKSYGIAPTINISPRGI